MGIVQFVHRVLFIEAVTCKIEKDNGKLLNSMLICLFDNKNEQRFQASVP